MINVSKIEEKIKSSPYEIMVDGEDCHIYQVDKNGIANGFQLSKNGEKVVELIKYKHGRLTLMVDYFDDGKVKSICSFGFDEKTQYVTAGFPINWSEDFSDDASEKQGFLGLKNLAANLLYKIK